MRTATLLKLGLLALFVPACSRTPIAPDPAATTPLRTQAPVVAPASTTASSPGITDTATTTRPLVDAPVRHASALRVDRLVVARGVVDREPQGTDTIFASDEKRVFAYVEVVNPEHAPGDLELQFIAPDGVAQAPVDVSVGPSPRWRTWAFTRHAHAPGTWKALVRDERGHILASTEFDVRS